MLLTYFEYSGRDEVGGLAGALFFAEDLSIIDSRVSHYMSSIDLPSNRR